MSRISTILLAATFAATVAVCGVAAQQPAAPSNSSTASGASETTATAAPSAADTKFIKEAAAGGMAEVALGQLAVEKASSADVKKFGQRMVDDHSKANDELKQLASRKT
jgi:putative membrane protein